MNLKMKKVIAWVLVCLCVFGSMPKEMVKAASSSTIYFAVSYTHLRAHET